MRFTQTLCCDRKSIAIAQSCSDFHNAMRFKFMQTCSHGYARMSLRHAVLRHGYIYDWTAIRPLYEFDVTTASLECQLLH